MDRNQILAALQPASHQVSIRDGAISFHIKDLTVRERDAWRTACTKDDGSLRPDWLLHLLHIAVLDESGQPVWDSIDAVDGPDAIVSEMASHVLRINGLAQDSQKDAQGN